MSQTNSTRTSSGQSRARGTSRTRNTQARGRQASAGRRSSVSQARRKSSRRNEPEFDYKKIFIGGVILILAIAVIVFLMKGITAKDDNEESTEETSTTEAVELEKEVMVDGITITGLSRESARAEILKQYPWSMTITYNGDVYEVTDLMGTKVDALLQEIYNGEPKESYTLDTSGLEEAVAKEVEVAAERWDMKAKNGSISSYDKASDTFLFTGAQSGLSIDREKLAADINAAIRDKDFDTAIEASGATVEPEFSESTAREKYKTIGTYTTTTTANEKRNTNVRLAAEAVNGTILQPGEEFSFNDVVGERTAAKGYKEAAAYSNGEVVDEIGGGVCQISSTMYNVVVRSGLKTTVRRSHTFEPSYVTPGTDAAVSWGGPDYKFMNNTSAAIGIRASYADRKVTISIYGIPVLEDGVTQSLESTKIKSIDSPAPTYEEDQTLQLDEEKVKSAGTLGSYWETKLIIKKDGTVISQEVDHNTTYKGHPPVILRNTSGVVVTSEGQTVETVESSEETTEGNSETGATTEPSTSAAGPSISGPGGTTAAPTPTESTTSPAGPGAPTSPAPTTAPETSTAAQPPTTAPQNEVQTVAPNPLGNGGGPG